MPGEGSSERPGVIEAHGDRDLEDGAVRLFVNPVVLGGGTPFFPPLPKRLDLELIEVRTFSQVVYLRYRRR